MIGDSTVGKTSLINRIRTGTFKSDPFPTIGIDFQVKIIIINCFNVDIIIMILIYSKDRTS